MARKVPAVYGSKEVGVNPLRTVWIPFVLSDPVLFQATINFAAVHLDNLYGQPNHVAAVARKGRTMRMVNEQLNTEATISNSTIGAVGMLVGMANTSDSLSRQRMNGDLEEVSIHLPAVARMVHIRGGVGSLGWEGVLHMFLFWEDLLSSAILATSPQLKPSSSSSFAKQTLIYAGLVEYSPTEGEDCYDPLIPIYQRLRFLSSHRSKCDLWSFSAETYGDLRSFVEESLKTLSTVSFHPAISVADNVFTLETHRLAALIYFNLVVLGHPRLSSFLQCLKDRLITLVQSAEGPLPGLKPRRRSALWVCFMGGLLSRNISEEVWFAEEIACTMGKTGCESWEDVEASLKEICWVDWLMDTEGIGKSLWQKVVDIRQKEIFAVSQCGIP
ncbi:hypothetical protein G7Y79_00031g065690 [Physcia stellaris]|nr:hypothetical protein G7Y79_00031g065690 [Physcia stellaris]